MMRSFKRIALLCGVGVLLSPVAWAENWQVAKNEDGIKVSLSEVAGSKYKAYQGVTVIKAPLAKGAGVAGRCGGCLRMDS